MKKILLAPDSFKGTLTSLEVCAVLKQAALSRFPECEVVSVPIADGGEGTADSFLEAVGGDKIRVTVENPFGKRIPSFYAVLPDRKTAVIEMSAAAGLPLAEGRPDPLRASTFGVGELILDALKRGCNHILLGLGGSATNDAGVGMAAALGVKFFDEAGKPFLPSGGTLEHIRDMDTSAADPLLEHCSFTAMCDVGNPLYGKNGAAFIFGPQKGADSGTVEILDRNLHRFSDFLKTRGIDVSGLPGGGAAGGLGAGVAAFLHGSLVSGIEAVLDTVGFEKMLEGTDLVLTGEGRIDSQSAQGKVISGVCRRAAAKNIPVIAIVGDIGEGAEEMYRFGLSSMFSINRRPLPFEEAKKDSRQNLLNTADSLFRLLGAFEKNQ